jgi:INO80 complex subunit C
MAPITSASTEETHQALIDSLDIYNVRKPFRSASWKPAQRRNKNVKQIISEATRKEASLLATQTNSGTSTPAKDTVPAIVEPASITHAAHLAQAATSKGPSVTYTGIECAPSFHPSSRRRYCDITGLPASYTDPKTRLRYHNGEIFGVLRTLGPGAAENYLAARGAHTVLK